MENSKTLQRLSRRLETAVGKAIADWQAYGAVSRRGKWMATLTMLACALIMLWCVPLAWVKGISIGSMACVCTWLWLRPLPPPG